VLAPPVALPPVPLEPDPPSSEPQAVAEATKNDTQNQVQFLI